MLSVVVGNNAKDGVTWVHSYVTPGNGKTFCIYDAPTPQMLCAAQHSAMDYQSIPSLKFECWTHTFTNLNVERS
jgi:hypothetical protein